MAEKTLQDVLDGLYAEGHDKEAVRQALLAKYGVDPAQLDPRTPYGHIQAAAPRLKELLGQVGRGLVPLDKAVEPTKEQALRAGPVLASLLGAAGAVHETKRQVVEAGVEAVRGGLKRLTSLPLSKADLVRAQEQESDAISPEDTGTASGSTEQQTALSTLAAKGTKARQDLEEEAAPTQEESGEASGREAVQDQIRARQAAAVKPPLPERERMIGGPLDPANHLRRLGNIVHGMADGFYPDLELQTADQHRDNRHDQQRRARYNAARQQILALNPNLPVPPEAQAPEYHPSQTKRINQAKRDIGLNQGVLEGVDFPTSKVKEELFHPKGTPSAISRAFQEQGEERHKRYKENSSFVTPLMDVQDILSGLIQMGAKATLPEWVPVTPEDPEGTEAAARLNREWGENFTGSAIGGTGALLKGAVTNPWETAVTRPLSLGLTVDPLLTPAAKYAAGKLLKHAPRFEPAFPTSPTEALRAEADASTTELHNSIPRWETGDPTQHPGVAGHRPNITAPTLVPPEKIPTAPTVFGEPKPLGRVGRAVSRVNESLGQAVDAKLQFVHDALRNRFGEDPAGRLTQILADGLRQRDPRATAWLDELVKDRERLKTAINSHGQRLEHLLGTTGETDAGETTGVERERQFREEPVHPRSIDAQGNNVPTPAPVIPQDYPVAGYPRGGVASPLPERKGVTPRYTPEAHSWDDILQNTSRDHPLREAINKVADGVLDLANPDHIQDVQGIMDQVLYRIGSLLRDEAPALLRDEKTRGLVVDEIVRREQRLAGGEQADWKAYRRAVDAAILKTITEDTGARGRGMNPGFYPPPPASEIEAAAHPQAMPVERPYPEGHPHEGRSRAEVLALETRALEREHAQELVDIRDTANKEAAELRYHLNTVLSNLDRADPGTPKRAAQMRAFVEKQVKAIEEKVARDVERAKEKLPEDIAKLAERDRDTQANWAAKREVHQEQLRKRMSDERLDAHQAKLAEFQGGRDNQPRVMSPENAPRTPLPDTVGLEPGERDPVTNLLPEEEPGTPHGAGGWRATDILGHLMKTLPEEERARIRSSTAKAVVGDLAEQAGERHMVKGLEGEAQRSMQGFEPPEEGTPKPHTELLNDEEDMSLRAEDSFKRAHVQDAVDKWADKWAQHSLNGGLEPQLIPAKFKGVDLNPVVLADALRNQASRIADPTQQARVLQTARRISEFKKLDPEIVPFDGYAPPRVAEALEWDVKSQQGVRSIVGKINSWVAANQVGRSPSALANNTVSNLGVLAVKYGRAVGPGFLLDMMGEIKGYEHYLRTGELPGETEAARHGTRPRDPVEAERTKQFYEAYRNSGAMDTDRVSQNIGAEAPGTGRMAASAVDTLTGGLASEAMLDKIKKGLAPVDMMNEFMADTYKQFGDQMFKLWAAREEFNRMNRYLEKLDPGEFVDLQVGPRKTARVTLRPDGAYDVTGSRAIESGARTMSHQQVVDELVSRAMTLPGAEIFLDYSEKGTYAKAMRGSHVPLVPILSQYYSYMYGALDIPFVKRGMISGVLRSTDGIVTNSRAIAGEAARSGASLALRRAIIANGVKQDLMSRSNDELLKVFRFAPNDLKVGIATALTEPDQVSVLALNNANALEPSMKLFSVLGAVARAFQDNPIEYAAKHPQDKAGLRALTKLYAGDGTATTADTLTLAGLGGSWLLQVHDRYEEATQQGRTLDAADLWDMFGNQVLGPPVNRAFQAGSSAIIEATDSYPTPSDNALQSIAKMGYSGRERALKRDAFASFLGTAIRQITSIGWDTRLVHDLGNRGASDRFFADMQAELLSSFGVPKAQALQEALERGNKPRAATRQLEQDMDVYRSVIEETVGDMQDNFDKVLDKLVRHRQGQKAR